MSDKTSKIKAGTASLALAACFLFVQIFLFVLVLIPERRLPEGLLAVGPTIGLASCFGIIAIPVPSFLGIVGLFQEGRQRLWGLLGLTLTALSLVVGCLAQAANWRQ